MDDKKIGMNIKKYRKGKFTQQELADKIDKTESSIRKYEKGLVTIPLDVLDKIASVLGVSVYDLVGISTDNLLQPLKDETVFRNYLLSLGYEYVDTFWDNDYGYDRCIHIISENKDIPLTKEEYENLKRNIKNDIDLEIERLRQYKRI